MGLIRNSVAATLGREAVVHNQGDLPAHADMLKARARAEAQKIHADARTERDRLNARAAK